MRPDFIPDANKNDEDIFSDEDIDRERTDVQTLLHTHCGTTRDVNEDDSLEDSVTYAHSKDAMRRANRIWGKDELKGKSVKNVKQTKDNASKYGDADIQQLKKETLKSQYGANTSNSASNASEAFFESKGLYSEKNLRHFLEGLRGDSSDKSVRCNSDQQDIVGRVVNQIIQDENYRMDRRRRRPQQFIRLLHGGPGTGKSHVIKILKEKLFEKELNWIAGVDFQIAAFQAVNADNVDGDTLHHALGLTPFGARKKTCMQNDKKKKVDASQRIAQWKWLIIDEISMVSANFLAELDMHLRQIMTDVSLMKKNTHGIDQPFGGINILFVGDFHQLDPPTGTPINAIPASFIQKAREYAPGATDEHGEYIFWGHGIGTVMGVSELTFCERHDNADDWLLEVQQQFRENKLSADNHAFLHGEPTKVPGSYVCGQLACSAVNCRTLLSDCKQELQS